MVAASPRSPRAVAAAPRAVAAAQPTAAAPSAPRRRAVEDAGTPRRHMSIEDVEGIGPAYADKLAAVGITTTDDLLAAGAKPL